MRPMHIAANAALFQRIEEELFVSLTAIGRVQRQAGSRSKTAAPHCLGAAARSGAQAGNYSYFVFPGGNTARAGGTTEDQAGVGIFLGCFGFFASRLPRCWPLGI
jgi:hypothetical protein